MPAPGVLRVLSRPEPSLERLQRRHGVSRGATTSVARMRVSEGGAFALGYINIIWSSTAAVGTAMPSVTTISSSPSARKMNYSSDTRVSRKIFIHSGRLPPPS